MALPATTIEMTHTGNIGETPVVIRQPLVLEPTKPQHGNRPWGPFAALTDATRGHLVAMIGEYVGTMMFLFFGFVAAQTGNEEADTTLRESLGFPVSSGPSLIQILYISTVFGLSLAANVFVWYRVSGGMFNPSVSLGLWLAGAITWGRLLCVIPAQLMGGISAAAIVSAILPGNLHVENQLGQNVSQAQGFVMEVLLTAMLMGTILMLAVEKHRTTFMAPLVIGVTLLIIHLVGINVSGASVNPARTLGPAVVNGHFVPEIWIYFVAPNFGAVMSVGLHWVLNALAYQTANPGQDGDGMEYYRVVPPTLPSGGSDGYSFNKELSYSPKSSHTTFPRAVITRSPPIQGQVFGKEGDETILLHENISTRRTDNNRYGAGGMQSFD